MLPLKGPSAYSDRTMFLVWADSLDMQFSFPNATQQIGSALLAMPLLFDRLRSEIFTKLAATRAE